MGYFTVATFESSKRRDLLVLCASSGSESSAQNNAKKSTAGDFRLKQIQNLGSSTALSKFDYVTDAASRITQWTQQRGSATAERYDFSYDNVDQMVGAILKNTGTGSSAGGSPLFEGTLSEPGKEVTVGGQTAQLLSQTNFVGNVNLTTGTNNIAVGRVTKLSGSVDSDMLYTGHQYHAQSGLFLVPYRSYDPNLGRWISRDPIGESGGINLYGYVRNNPVNYIDPLGLDVWNINDSAAAGGGGHGAAIVGQPGGDNFTYHSYGPKNGLPKEPGVLTEKSFPSLEEAMEFAKKEGYDRAA